MPEMMQSKVVAASRPSVVLRSKASPSTILTPGKFSTMVLEIGARALTKHALNVHCAHDDFYAALDTGWTMLVSKDAQQAADQAIILRKVNEISLNPGMNIQDGMLTTHSEHTFRSKSPQAAAPLPPSANCSARSAAGCRR